MRNPDPSRGRATSGCGPPLGFGDEDGAGPGALRVEDLEPELAQPALHHDGEGAPRWGGEGEGGAGVGGPRLHEAQGRGRREAVGQQGAVLGRRQGRVSGSDSPHLFRPSTMWNLPPPGSFIN